MNVSITELYSLKPRALWKAFIAENFAFWMACAYLFFEYVRPQSIWPIFDIYPYWASTFLLLTLIGWIFNPNRKLVWTWATTGIFTYLFLVILSSFTAYWPDISWFYFNDFFNWVVVFFALTQAVTTRKQFFIFLCIFLVASFKMSQFGAISWGMSGFAFRDWGIAGPQGYFNNPGELAIQMLILFGISLFFIYALKDHIGKWLILFLSFMPITAVITILGTNTRGSQLALAVMIFYLITMTKHRFKILPVLFVIFIISYQLLPDQQKQKIENAGSDGTSVQRLLYWEHGWEMMKEHPLLGVGYFNFAPYYTVHYPHDLVLGKDKAELPHNIFIQVGTDTGFLGLGVFMFLLYKCYRTTRIIGIRAREDGDIFVENISKGLNIALIGFVVAGQFVTVTYYPFIWIHLSFITIMQAFLTSENTEKTV